MSGQKIRIGALPHPSEMNPAPPYELVFDRECSAKVGVGGYLVDGGESKLLVAAYCYPWDSEIFLPPLPMWERAIRGMIRCIKADGYYNPGSQLGAGLLEQKIGTDVPEEFRIEAGARALDRLVFERGSLYARVKSDDAVLQRTYAEAQFWKTGRSGKYQEQTYLELRS